MTVTQNNKLELLAELEGFEDTMSLLEAATFDSVSPGICMTPGCDYTTEVEPDQRSGYCEVCNKNTVSSALMIAGII